MSVCLSARQAMVIDPLMHRPVFFVQSFITRAIVKGLSIQGTFYSINGLKYLHYLYPKLYNIW